MTAPAAASPEVLGRLAELVEARSGMRFTGPRSAELVSKAAQAFATSGCATWQVYLERLSHPVGSGLLGQLVEALTVGETYFYRHRSYFDELERVVLPELIERRRQSRWLRLWSAGCATGEEAYSLAILVHRLLPDIDDWQVSILATDLNRTFLARAEAGVYSNWSFRETDVSFKQAHFVADGQRHRIRPEYRRLIRFEQLNLAEDSYPSAATGTTGIDVILCRNVVLYFAPELARRVIERLRAALIPGGWLMIGPSDPVPGLLAGFEMHAAHDAIVYRRVDDPNPARSPQACLSSGRDAIPSPTQLATGPARLTNDEPVAAPDWQQAWCAARASADRGELDEAEAHCRRAIAQAGLRPEPYYLLGMLRQARGDDAGALAAFRQASYADGAFVPALLGQAAVYRRSQAPDRARQILGRARRLLEGRGADEVVLADEGLSVGRLRDALSQALGDEVGRRG